MVDNPSLGEGMRGNVGKRCHQSGLERLESDAGCLAGEEARRLQSAAEKAKAQESEGHYTAAR